MPGSVRYRVQHGVSDDKADLRAVMLKHLGYQVLEAGSAHEALNTWRTSHAKVDLRITGLVMAGGMTGLELAEQLLREKPTLQAVLVSGCCAEVVNSGVPESERARFLGQPFSASLLAKTRRGALDGG